MWSIDQQKKAGSKGAPWDGVRNYQAAKNLKNMRVGDLCFFYHSNIGKEIVGIVEVIKEAFPDVTDKKNKSKEIQDSVDSILVIFNKEMSTWDPNSEISIFNRWNSLDSFKVSKNFYNVVEQALIISKKSNKCKGKSS